MDVSQMKEGEKAKVIDIQGGWGMLRKLGSLGIRPGVEITKISSQFLRGPITIQVANTQVAFGYGMARKIIVKV